MITVAALYIDPKGPYPKMPGVECWDEQRDAKLYEGPHPIVAHPPCGPWGRLRHLCKYQDPGCGPRAVEQVRRWGGVLEHPADSRLWWAMAMPLPGELPDAFGGITIEVEQVRWGHVCQKRTWLYLVGAVPGPIPPPAVATKRVGPHRNGRGGLPHATKFERRATPPAFAEWLVSMARQARSRGTWDTVRKLNKAGFEVDVRKK